MSSQIKARMLRCIAQKPRTLLFFTTGEVHATVNSNHLERYLGDLAGEGFVSCVDGRYHITTAGRAELDRPTTKAESRAWCAASTRGAYKPPIWNVRAGADAHLQHRSRGV